MSAIVNISVFVLTASILNKLINSLTNNKAGSYINSGALHTSQKLTEIKNGVAACCIFAVGSLLTRELFNEVWPSSFIDLLSQIVTFALFYETYSYAVHRLMHLPAFRKIHGVHHKSIRVTPWSAYSVHPIEASFIGISAPIFMLLLPLSLGVALTLHILGMMFTIFLHSNYKPNIKNIAINKLFQYTDYHAAHHLLGNVNFGFVNSFWDYCFKTKANKN
jgi:sterol desaturase/sphingolipid hydroxylase (fatty acid hydroxylase superfamily)